MQAQETGPEPSPDLRAKGGHRRAGHVLRGAGQEAGGRRESSGRDHQGPHGVTQRGARRRHGWREGWRCIAVVVVGGGRPLGGWAGALCILCRTHSRVFQRGRGCSPPPRSTGALTQDAVRVRSGGQRRTRLPQSSRSSGGSCLGLAGTTCPPLGLPWGAPGALGRKHRPGARNT